MISEVSFATQYTSLWHILLPNSERFIRQINQNISKYSKEIESAETPARRGFLNEIAFQRAKLSRDYSNQSVTNATALARERLSQIERNTGSDLADPNAAERPIIRAIESALSKFVGQRSRGQRRVIFEPEFAGCGFVDSSIGDVLVGDELYEVKAGERHFRSTDVRQLLTYCALNSAAKRYSIRRSGCVNPRRGTYFSLDVDALAFELAGKSSTELFSDIVYYMSNSGISR